MKPRITLKTRMPANKSAYIRAIRGSILPLRIGCGPAALVFIVSRPLSGARAPTRLPPIDRRATALFVIDARQATPLVTRWKKIGARVSR
jgi:hypothetical protein